MGKLIIHNLDPEQTKFFIGHLLQMGFPFSYGPENFQEPQPPPAPAADAATAQSTSTARANSTQPSSQTVMQNPMEGWSVSEQKNKDEEQEDWNAEQEKTRLLRKRSIDQPPDPATIRQAFQDMGIHVSYRSPSDAHRKDGKVALPSSASKPHPTLFGNPEPLQADNRKILLEHKKERHDSASQHRSPKNTTPPPSSKSSFWNMATIVPKPDDMAKSSPIGPSLVNSEQKNITSPKPKEPVTSTQPLAPAEKKVQELHPKVEEQKSSPQLPQKKKKWTKRDEQDLDECGGVLVDMINGSTSKPVSSSIEQQQQRAAAPVSIPRDLTKSESLNFCQSIGPRMHQLDQSRNRTGGQSFNSSFQVEDQMGPPFSRPPSAVSVQAFPSHVQTDGSGFPISQMSFDGRGSANQRGGGNWGRGNGSGNGYWRSNRNRNRNGNNSNN